MGWKSSWFGSETPNRRQILTTVLPLTALVLTFHGLYVDQIPASALYGWHAAVFFLAVGIAGMIGMVRYSIHIGTWTRALQSFNYLGLLLAFLVGPLMFGLIAWLIFVKSIPWGYTRMFGEEYREQVVMTTHYNKSRRTCDYRLLGVPVERSFPGYLCINESYYRLHPEQPVEVLLTGKRSALGINIQQIHVRK